MNTYGGQSPPTANDVASLAGVSQSAVSRAFTPGASISAKTRQRVEAAAEQLGYRPNLIARSLITRRSNIIGVSAGNMHNQFYPLLLEQLSVGLQKKGKRILLFGADPHRDVDPELEEVLRYQVDGLILAATSLSSRLADECQQARVPVVLINRVSGSGGVSSVSGDNVHGARAIADLLVRRGHQRIAWIAGLENSSTSQDRERGFFGRCVELGAPAPLRDCGHYREEGAREAARRLLSRPDRPDALFCANDHMAFAAMDVARFEFGLAVGSEVSIVGFDDVAMAAWKGYDLTTYSQPVAEMTAAALELIDSHDGQAVHRTVPGALIERGSVRPAR